MYKVFVDIRWSKVNTKGKITNEITQIGAVAGKEESQSLGILIKPTNLEVIKEVELEKQGLTKTQLEEEKSENDAIKKLYKTFKEPNLFIIQNPIALEIFKTALKKAGIDLEKKTFIVFENLLDIIMIGGLNKNLSTKELLYIMEIEFDNEKLIFSKDRVIYLKEMYQKAKTLYKIYLHNYAFLYKIRKNENDETLHFRGCPQVKKEAPQKLEEVYTLNIFERDKICEHCLKNKAWQLVERWIKPEPREKHSPKHEKKVIENQEIENHEIENQETKIHQQCSKLDMDCKIAQGIIFISTKVGVWRIYYEKDKVNRVHHGNLKIATYQKNKNEHKNNRAFHNQKLKLKTISEVIEYIYFHDQYYENKIYEQYCNNEKKELQKP